MPLGRAVLTAHWLGVATGWLWELLWRGGYWLALGAALAGWLLAGSGKLHWRGGYWLALGAALAGATIRLHGSLEYSTVE